MRERLIFFLLSYANLCTNYDICNKTNGNFCFFNPKYAIIFLVQISSRSNKTELNPVDRTKLLLIIKQVAYEENFYSIFKATGSRSVNI